MDIKTTREVTTNIALLAVSLGVSAVINTIVKTNTPVDTKKITQILIKVGTYALTATVWKTVEAFTREEIKAVWDAIEILLGTTEPSTEDPIEGTVI
jgi:hypothetical protein